jgi:redox-sensitive bicupin YhaK (pirin superfamily)
MRELRRADQRFVTIGAGVQTWHSFSYGRHYDPDQIRFGPIMAINFEQIEPGRGYDEHQHADVEIVTWVLEGVLRHEDSTGQSGEVRPGVAQRLSAGAGVQHAEHNASADERLIFVQMMLVSDHDGPPEYEQAEVAPETGALSRTVDVHAPAELFALTLESGMSLAIPGAPRSLLIVTSGELRCGDITLGPGDEVRFTDDGEYDLSASSAATALIWQLQR